MRRQRRAPRRAQVRCAPARGSGVAPGWRVVQLAVVAGLCSGVVAGPVSITLDGRQGGRVFEGIGALSAGASSRLLMEYPEAQRSQVLDYLFKPHYGAGFQHLKVEIGGDVNSTDGCEPSHQHTRADRNFERGYEWWLMREAKRRNPEVFLDCLEWGAPAWIGNGDFNSQDNADYIAEFLLGARRVHGLNFDFTGGWNETRADMGFFKRLRETLDRRGLGAVQIVAADHINRWSLVDVMAGDATLAQAVAVVGVHYPKTQSPPAAQACGKRIWASEDGPWKENWAGAAALAWAYNRNYITGRMTKTIIWSPVTAYYNILPLPGSGVLRANTPWSGHYEVKPALWATAHTTQFAAPGWQYLDPACLVTNGASIVALKSTNGADFSIIVETMEATDVVEAVFEIGGGLATGPVHVWRTSVKEQFVQLADVTPEAGRFHFEFAPGCVYSLTTTTGQRKGDAAAPPPELFPDDYREDFERYAPGSTPRYFADQAGIFEVARRSKGEGQCLRQVVTAKGIEWPFHLNPPPETFLGSEVWSDYAVSADTLIERAGYVALFGRVGRIQEDASAPDGYCLKVDQDGWWELGDARHALASGRVAFGANTWHRLGLLFRGDRITASFDGQEVATVRDTSYGRGMVGLGCGWHGAEFDNVAITVDPDDANLAFGHHAKASSVADADTVADNVTDGDAVTTRWCAMPGWKETPWLEIDLGAPTEFNSTTFRPFEDRLLGYKIQWWDGVAWVEAATGGAPGPGWRTHLFPRVRSDRVRLLITAARDTPSVWEFEVRNRH